MNKKTPVNLSFVSSKCQSLLLQQGYRKIIQPSQYFSKEGAYPKEIGLVESGLLRIYYLDEAGKEWNKAFLRNANFVMATPNIEEKSSTYIQALLPTHLFCISIEDWQKAAITFPELKTLHQQVLMQYMKEKQEREISLLAKDARQRYAAFQKQFPDLEELIPHYHIASYLGITPTQLSRIRKK